MRTGLALQRCWHHPSREAVARCPECHRSYCRECIVEHAGRIICSDCLARLSDRPKEKKRSWPIVAVLRSATGAIIGILVAWMAFFSLGRFLLDAPDEFHARSLWKRTFGESVREGADE